MSERAGFGARWAAFVRERFSPAAHAIMVLAFFFGNVAAAQAVQGGMFAGWRLLPALLVVAAFFLRLRIFDELKDLEHDKEVNPTRPLARGLIPAQEAKAVALALLLGEGALCLLCSMAVFWAWCLAAGWSLFMYKEFFVGPWLRPKLELYAITHTLVAGLLGLVPAAAWSGAAPWHMDPGLWWFGLGNWCLFNVFEFSRKTFAPSEEREGVDSYSRRLGAWGAAGLSWANMLGGCAAMGLVLARGGVMGQVAVPAFLALDALAIGVSYALRPTERAARTFRAVTLGCALFAYLLLAVLVTLGGEA